MEMMMDRGYQRPYEKTITNFPTPILVACNDVEECYIFFGADSKLGVQEFRKFQTILEQNNIRHSIIVSNLGATSFTSSILQKMDSAESEVELFPYRYLVRNPTRHSLYRPHRALSEEEKQQFLHKMHCSDSTQLKKLFRDDRICQYFNFPIGTIVETSRCYGSTGPYKSYRIVEKNKT